MDYCCDKNPLDFEVDSTQKGQQLEPFLICYNILHNDMQCGGATKWMLMKKICNFGLLGDYWPCRGTRSTDSVAVLHFFRVHRRLDACSFFSFINTVIHKTVRFPLQIFLVINFIYYFMVSCIILSWSVSIWWQSEGYPLCCIVLSLWASCCVSPMFGLRPANSQACREWALLIASRLASYRCRTLLSHVVYQLCCSAHAQSWTWRGY